MPVFRYPFVIQANSAGEIGFVESVTPPISGVLLSYSIETETGCIERVHPTTLIIHRDDDPDDKVEIAIDIPDCTKVAGPVDYRVRAGKSYVVHLNSEEFSQDEIVEGTLTVRYRIGATRTLDWERQYEAEEALKAEMRDNLQGRYVEKDTNPGKERCPLDGTKRKHGKRDYHYFEIEPDYTSLEIWVDWQGGRARGSMRIHRVFAHVNQKQYHKCTGQVYSATVEARGYVDLHMNIDVSSGRADVALRADLTVTDYWGLPQWPFLEDTIKDLIEGKSQSKINEKIPGYERLIEDRINSAKGSPARLAVASALEFVSYEALRDDESLYEILIEDFILFGRGRFQLLAFDELNPEYIAAVLNNQSYESTVARINLGSSLWLEDFHLTLRTEDSDGNGSIFPGDVRVFTAPAIRVQLDSATAYFSFTSKTNLLASGQLDGSGHFSLSMAHTYEQPKIEFGTLQIEHLESPQLNPGLTRFVREKLNQNLPDHIANDDALLGDIATLLNDRIRDVIESRQDRRFLSRGEFLAQISALGRYVD